MITADLPYFHGGFGGLSVGQIVLPPSRSGAPSTASFGAAAVCNRDAVYVTPDFEAAMMFACAHQSGRGKVYQVEPIGELARDPDAKGDGYSFECPAARVVRVFKIRGKIIRKTQKMLLEGTL
ncbi:NAD(+)--rifampin ADP-ribosyltransferase [Rhizobium sp. 18065]|uniref:NAD(+)--rifampin ADP-ribosyltransferase n=1 Tax=Rhizobium sp. 18065 TaxID=2681411 RepID=UPI001FCEA03F|nr:NAD(+)--rifampin ADP-ribosyltransferase [Rhizobium sp. 18065]